ncbi:replicative DNA helicase [candidate division WOR-1 bacterium RIFOXYA12_FULL_52_29]|uniref:Replicative DNA helicase n=1 Tax=candidate division WOR-1 bacterium RIFOXYC12_FULL_54_18 TaxID=1802584 RepID=A0A1F4T4R5_UNCSA|nr:MAG: replicative DNA helicase [candidate division WOR-1 bacterium RIFOXYA2_FULL_51_19]OGC17281.1 MAG: replicative DNA helicase [candidate division WOR-1 bacterium RIFOXYA12_FULL_52_29]OGC26141.1 MAG: replicative DNA helicase [candidate division WOR-1 bacterium RIFOXYB2_FULL_45_9]OGC27698.1 MAG: replicative DNA helicase [candidate division WOR-1 bacterium RIFOXYC12_FULL_54_18]OGC30011.1 MAG: replicative DNA helicase [candidate division WOR-1 bacterium RIFOXYB12_FULL_52_16]
MAEDKIPPQNLAAEQSVLGSMLLDKNAVFRAAEALAPDSFYRDAHRYIFEAILVLFDKGEPVDLVTVTETLRKSGKLDAVGGSVYVADLINSVPTAANVDHYTKIVEEKYILRRLIESGTSIVGEAFSDPHQIDDVLDNAEKMIFDIAMRHSREGFHKIDSVIKNVLDKIDSLYGKNQSITGVPTGYADLDNMTAGFQNSELIILAARPSVGKTAFALNIAQDVAIRSKIPVAIFSLEMSKESLAQRMLCAEAEIEQQKLKTATLSDTGWKKLTRALGRLSEAPIYIDDSASMSSTEIRAKARRLKLEKGLGLIIVDYLQLMRGNKSRVENRVQEISEIARSLKVMARELECPVVALSQLSRAVEQRPDRIPRLSDLRESGEIEQTADLVMFIHRDDYYNPQSERGNIAEIIIAKQRNGPVGQLELVFRKEIAKFASKESRYEEVA